MSSSKTTLIVFLEYMLITIDILCNALTDFIGRTMISRLSAYVLQDLCLILALIIFFLLFFRKKILQQRLLTCLLKENWVTFATTLSYLALTIILQSMTVEKMAAVIKIQQTKTLDSSSLDDDSGNTRVDPSFWMDDTLIVVFFMLHRIISAFYYFSYRNSTANLHDSNLIQMFKPRTDGNTTTVPSISPPIVSSTLPSDHSLRQ